MIVHNGKRHRARQEVSRPRWSSVTVEDGHLRRAEVQYVLEGVPDNPVALDSLIGAVKEPHDLATPGAERNCQRGGPANVAEPGLLATVGDQQHTIVQDGINSRIR